MGFNLGFKGLKLKQMLKTDVKSSSVPITTLTCLRFQLDVLHWLRVIPCWCWLSCAGYSPRVKGYNPHKKVNINMG